MRVGVVVVGDVVAVVLVSVVVAVVVVSVVVTVLVVSDVVTVVLVGEVVPVVLVGVVVVGSVSTSTTSFSRTPVTTSASRSSRSVELTVAVSVTTGACSGGTRSSHSFFFFFHLHRLAAKVVQSPLVSPLHGVSGEGGTDVRQALLLVRHTHGIVAAFFLHAFLPNVSHVGVVTSRKMHRFRCHAHAAFPFLRAALQTFFLESVLQYVGSGVHWTNCV